MVKLTLFSSTGSQMHDGIGNIIRQSVVGLFEDPKKFECRFLYEDGSKENFVKVSDDGSFSRKSVSLNQDLSRDMAIWFGQTPDSAATGTSFNPKEDPELSPKRLSHVAKHIGNSYAVVCACLGVETAVVEQERYQQKHLDFRSQLTKILLRWRALQKGRASLGKLIEAMKMNNLSHEEMLLDPVWAGETAMTKLKDA
ncbi:uncharacterized protein LOC110444463, partial [Mizuhopecten yessoensis]|uniref:uncharacterized protein LOC110444463 n=1 Tax=Mizuhopecten yessoensis TaxID=6573 RepID=UPI000B457159